MSMILTCFIQVILSKTLMNFSNLTKKIWLNANKISRSVKKTELVIFKTKRQQFDGEIMKVKSQFSQLTVFNI